MDKNSIPDADVVTVTRCADCMHKARVREQNYGYCVVIEQYVANDFYCACGARKEKEK